jgi:hypothetical protein
VKVRYHEDFEKNIKNKYTPVIDSPETTRAIENQKLVSSVEYKGIKNQISNSSLSNSSNPTNSLNNTSTNNNNSNNNNNNSNNNIGINSIPNNTTLIATFRSGEKKLTENPSQRRIGSIADYDPLKQEQKTDNGNDFINNNGNNSSNGHGSNGNGIVNANGNGSNNNSILNKQYSYNVKNQQQQHNNVNGYSNGNISNGNKKNTNGNGNGHGNGHDQYHDVNDDNNNSYSSKQHQQNLQQQPYDFINDIKTSVYKAIYDYDAREDDEISFRDGDKFINCEQIDIGWMIGKLMFI